MPPFLTTSFGDINLLLETSILPLSIISVPLTIVLLRYVVPNILLLLVACVNVAAGLIVNLIGSADTFKVILSVLLIVAGAFGTGTALFRQSAVVLHVPLTAVPNVIYPAKTKLNVLEKVQALVKATCITPTLSAKVIGIVKIAVVAVVAPITTSILLIVA